jgi:hypothetical protein
MSGARDSQRSKVYRWERASIPGWQEGEWRREPVRRYRTSDGEERTFSRQRVRIDREMSLADCAALVAKVWAAYRPGAAPPTLTPGFLARRATGSRDRINLPRWARQPAVVLHETAHSLVPPLRWKEAPRAGGHPLDRDTVVPVAWHGPEFVRLFIELLVRYHAPARGMRGELLRSARAAKIKVGALQDCRKPARSRSV